MSTRAQILATMRNTILLSLLLGLTWITAIFYYSPVQQYITVILNASTGLYILAYSVLANREVRGEVKEKMSDLMSNFPTNTEDKTETSNGDSYSGLGEIKSKITALTNYAKRKLSDGSPKM